MYHTAPKKLFEELIHAFDAVAAISLAADGKMAVSALERGIPFFGLMLTQTHGLWLRERLKGVVFKKFQDPPEQAPQGWFNRTVGQVRDYRGGGGWYSGLGLTHPYPASQPASQPVSQPNII